MTVRYQIVCRKYASEGRCHVWSEWWPTSEAADQAQVELLAQAYWDEVSPPIPVMVPTQRPPLAAGGWNVATTQLPLFPQLSS